MWQNFGTTFYALLENLNLSSRHQAGSGGLLSQRTDMISGDIQDNILLLVPHPYPKHLLKELPKGHRDAWWRLEDTNGIFSLPVFRILFCSVGSNSIDNEVKVML